MVTITAEYIVKLFEEDARARKRLAELLVSEPDVRLAIINAVLRDVATKQDLVTLREEFRRELRDAMKELRERDLKEIREGLRELREYVDRGFERLEERVTRLEERVAHLEKRMSMLTRVVFAFNLPILLAVIGLLLERLLRP